MLTHFMLLSSSIVQKTVRENCFSKHDNRHSFQNSGVYFGQVKCTINYCST